MFVWLLIYKLLYIVMVYYGKKATLLKPKSSA